MEVVLLHEALAADARDDELDVFEQAAAVAAALDQLGHRHRMVAFSGDGAAAMHDLQAHRPDVVFNLVECVDGRGEHVDRVPALLAAAGLPFTGSGERAMRETASKIVVKQRLAAAGVPTPFSATREQLAAGRVVPPGRYIVKSVFEHGSLGLEDDCVVFADGSVSLLAAIDRLLSRLGGVAFAEAYVHGREFNLALLAGAGGVENLPAAEIRFAGAGRADTQIVGYRAKWRVGSAEDLGTPRSFDFAPHDAALVARLAELARATWGAFDLRGYARVDFRVDAAGRPWAIDVNTNPCLSPDAGFQAALRRAGIPFATAVARILADALRVGA
ncbi:MAG: D-alanine--D-alanine ligase [Planctomycetota bacterium]